MLTVNSATAVFFLVSFCFHSSSPAFLAPITKDLSTHKHTLSVYLNTPPQATNLLLDLGAASTLVDCHVAHSLPTRKNEPAGRPVTGSLSMPVTDGSNPGQLGSVPDFAFSCNKRSSLKGLVKGAAGIAGLGWSNLSIPAQVSNFSSENLVFALCLSGSPSAPGVAFFGSFGPYNFLPKIDLSKYLHYTPLVSNPTVTTARKGQPTNPSSEYFIPLTSIKVNGKAIDFDRSLLIIDRKGRGGTQLSTVVPYTLLQTSIFEALTRAFVEESSVLNLTVTRSAKPFRVCYEADEVSTGRVGPAVPTIDLVLGGGDGSTWRIFGSNSMVRIYRDEGRVDVWCLGFVDRGARPGASVVIGAHQMEDNLLRFDLELGRLGFSSSVLVHGTMCANFNFTTNDNLR